jgi:hypothetical protein
MATRNRDTKKKNNRTQKRKTQNPTPRSLLSLQNNPLYFEATSTRGRRLRLAGVSICNRTVAGQPDVESLCPSLPIVGIFSAERRRWVQKSYFYRWSRWVSKREIRLGSDIRSGKNGVDGDETRKNGRENDQTNTGVVRYDFGKTDLHPQVAEGDGRTLISIGG